jgi:hypothetical protein
MRKTAGDAHKRQKPRRAMRGFDRQFEKTDLFALAA